MANVKRPFVRTMSLGSMFRRRKEPAYQFWEDEDSLLDEDAIKPVARRRAATEPQKPVIQFREETLPMNLQLEDADSPDGTGSERTHLADCFYLGSYDMTGLTIKGRGCIDYPAGQIWEQTQEDNKQGRRKHSYASLEGSCKPRYVRLIACSDELQIYDYYTNERIIKFNYRTISFVGTHPKHTRLFSFVAVQSERRTPFCHAFKCEDVSSASNTAFMLSSEFQRKNKELQAKQQQRTIQVEASATFVN